MKGHDLLDAVGGINEKYIYNAGNDKTKKSKSYFKWISVAAACLCLIVIVGITIPRLFNSTPDSGQDSQPIIRMLVRQRVSIYQLLNCRIHLQ